MHAISVVTAPAGAAVTLADVKDHLRIDADDDDAYITRLIAGAAARVEAYTGRRLIEQTLDVYMSDLPIVRTRFLPVAPVSSVTSIEVETTDRYVTVPPADYDLVTFGGPDAPQPLIRRATGASWPAWDTSLEYPVRIRVVAGYGAAPADVPEGLRQAISIIVGGWYEARQDWVAGGPPGQYGPLGIGGVLSGAVLSDTIMDQYRLLWAV